MQQFSDFMVYVDESGDHSLTSIDKNYPIFVLAFCVFYKKHYLTQVVTKVQKLKFDTFGHDFVILHEHEIRKEKGEFNIFKSFEEKQAFLENLNLIMKESNFGGGSKSRLALNKLIIDTPLSTLYNSLILKGLKFNNFLAKNCKPSIYRALEKRVESQVDF